MPKEATLARLAISPDVLRELFLKSGNVCAFPGCAHPIVNSDGTYVAQLCHIEAASPGGQRYNPAQTDQERAAFDNLLLLCYRHHKETDDVTKFTVTQLKRIKADHEIKFSSIIDSIGNDVRDLAFATNPILPKTLTQLITNNEIQSNEEKQFLIDLQKLANALKDLSPLTRKIFLLALNRVDYQEVNLFNFIKSLSMNESDAYQHIKSLENAGVLYDNEDSDFTKRCLKISTMSNESPFPISIIISDFCKNNAIDANTMFMLLDFSALA